jgi:hypothetical protein
VIGGRGHGDEHPNSNIQHPEKNHPNDQMDEAPSQTLPMIVVPSFSGCWMFSSLGDFLEEVGGWLLEVCSVIRRAVLTNR